MLDKLKQSKNLIILGLVCLVVGYLICMQTRPSKVITEIKTVEIEKLVYRESINNQTKKATISTTDSRKGITTVVALEDSNTQSNTELSKDMSKFLESKTIEHNKQNGLFAGPCITCGKDVKVGVDLILGNVMTSVNIKKLDQSVEAEGYVKLGFFF